MVRKNVATIIIKVELKLKDLRVDQKFYTGDRDLGIIIISVFRWLIFFAFDDGLRHITVASDCFFDKQFSVQNI